MRPGTARRVSEAQQARVLFAAFEATRVHGPPITTGQLRAAYLALCERTGAQPLRYTQFWTHLRTLGWQGRLVVQHSSRGVMGRTSIITLPPGVEA